MFYTTQASSVTSHILFLYVPVNVFISAEAHLVSEINKRIPDEFHHFDEVFFLQNKHIARIKHVTGEKLRKSPLKTVRKNILEEFEVTNVMVPCVLLSDSFTKGQFLPDYAAVLLYERF